MKCQRGEYLGQLDLSRHFAVLHGMTSIYTLDGASYYANGLRKTMVRADRDIM